MLTIHLDWQNSGSITFESKDLADSLTLRGLYSIAIWTTTFLFLGIRKAGIGDPKLGLLNLMALRLSPDGNTQEQPFARSIGWQTCTLLVGTGSLAVYLLKWQ